MRGRRDETDPLSQNDQTAPTPAATPPLDNPFTRDHQSTDKQSLLIVSVDSARSLKIFSTTAPHTRARSVKKATPLSALEPSLLSRLGSRPKPPPPSVLWAGARAQSTAGAEVRDCAERVVKERGGNKAKKATRLTGLGEEKLSLTVLRPALSPRLPSQAPQTQQHSLAISRTCA